MLPVNEIAHSATLRAEMAQMAAMAAMAAAAKVLSSMGIRDDGKRTTTQKDTFGTTEESRRVGVQNELQLRHSEELGSTSGHLRCVRSMFVTCPPAASPADRHTVVFG